MSKPFTIDLKQAKKFFFDTKLVESTVDRATKNALGKMGAFIRQTARKSMRHKKTKPAPGAPAKKSPDKINLRFILYNYEPKTNSVVVGPVKLSRRKVANLMEFGGTVETTFRTGRVVRRKRARYRARPFLSVRRDGGPCRECED